ELRIRAEEIRRARTQGRGDIVRAGIAVDHTLPMGSADHAQRWARHAKSDRYLGAERAQIETLRQAFDRFAVLFGAAVKTYRRADNASAYPHLNADRITVRV